MSTFCRQVVTVPAIYNVQAAGRNRFKDLEDAFSENMHNGEGQESLVYHSHTPVYIGSFCIISVTHD